MEAAYSRVMNEPDSLTTVSASLENLKLLKELAFNPFLSRMIEVLIAKNNGTQVVNLLTFLQLMRPFCYSTPIQVKKDFLFQMYDKDSSGLIPIVELKNILTNELFVRSHWEDVENAKDNPGEAANLKSCFSDRVMKSVMIEIMEQYDADGNKQIDKEEFNQMVTDSDVDMLMSLYGPR